MLASLTYYRMPDQGPTASTISGLMDALWAALSSATDYNGTALAATHAWTWAREGTTKSVYGVPPTGTMTRGMKILIAGDTAGAPTMASPDAFVASCPMAGIALAAGAYTAWASATPFTSGIWSGYWKMAGTTYNLTSAKVRCFISQEDVIIALITTTGNVQAWAKIGAIIDANASGGRLGTDAETDGRLYGMFTTGAGSVPAAWQNGIPANGPVQHYTSDGSEHMMVFAPGTSAFWTCGRGYVTHNTQTAARFTFSSGAYGGHPIVICKATSGRTFDGSLIGNLRGVQYGGKRMSGTVAPAAGTTTAHFLSPDTTSAAADGIILTAAA